MEQAFSVVSEVLKEAVEKGAKLKSDVELRFYASPYPQKQADEQSHYWGNPCDALQLFQINPDKTVSPLDERRVLPPNVIFNVTDFTGLGFDKEKNIMFLDLKPDGKIQNQGVFVFIQTDLMQQAPRSDRMIILFDGRVYEDGGDDIQEQARWNALPATSTSYRASAEVRQ
jgi:hypothetical protein